jgi:hypothetical protein
MVLSGTGCRALLSAILAGTWPGCAGSGAALAFEPNAAGTYWATRNAIFNASLQNVGSVTLRDAAGTGVVAASNAGTVQIVGADGLELLNAANGLSLGVLGPGLADAHDVITALDGALVIAISTTAGVVVYDRR